MPPKFKYITALKLHIVKHKALDHTPRMAELRRARTQGYSSAIALKFNSTKALDLNSAVVKYPNGTRVPKCSSLSARTP